MTHGTGIRADQTIEDGYKEMSRTRCRQCEKEGLKVWDYRIT